jgi:hypothetical protein
MYDQNTADILNENEALRRELYEQDKRHGLLSGMTEEGAREYADRLALHPSRRKGAPTQTETPAAESTRPYV